jgi:GT2 family glycosyltransferase
LDRIEEWANGKIDANSDNHVLRHLVTPAYPKPIPFLRIEPQETINLAERSERLFLVQTGSNLGFAGGSNIGLRLALADGDTNFTWLLNNDTVVDPDALTRLLDRMEGRPDVGICGSTLLYYYRPNIVQALGGSSYNRWTARVGHLGMGLSCGRVPTREWVEHRMDYVVGASLFVSVRFLKDIGLMNEQYFLYFEEIDWATRAKGRYTLAYAPQSIVYHKAGASTGTARRRKVPSVISEYYSNRARLLFTRKFEPVVMPTVIASVCASLIHRLAHGQFRNAGAIVRGSLGFPRSISS